MIQKIEYRDVGTDNKNTLDEYKAMAVSEIRDVLDQDRVPMINVCMNLTSDFNKASVVRANNAFLGSAVYFVGAKKYDRRGTVGTHHYEHVYHAETADELITDLRERGYTLYAVDNTPEFNPSVIYDVELPEKTAFFYGEEMLGLSAEVVQRCDAAIYIPQYGSVRSINVAQAASICMSEYSRRHR